MSTSSLRSSASRISISAPLTKSERLAQAARKGWTPPPRIGLPDWADKFRVLAKEAGSTSGKYRTGRVEVARGAMLAATEPGVRKISAMVATQLMKSTLIENLVGYHIHFDPCPILIVQPTEKAANQFSKERIETFIRATPALSALVGSRKSRDSGSTIDYKAFPGGFVGIVGAGSPDNLARRPIRILLLDEVDKYIILKEGRPGEIAAERLATFESNSLDVAVCSPTITDESEIERRYRQSDQRRASVACPHCGHRQFLDFFRHVQWKKGIDGKTHQPETAQIFCECCGSGWSEGQRLRALNTIRWHQTRPFECCGERQVPLDRYDAAVAEGQDKPVDQVWHWWASRRWAVYRAKCSHCGTWAVPNTHAGYQASKLYSPWGNDTPPRLAEKWLAAKDDEDGKLTFYNTSLALTYKKFVGAGLSDDALLARREVWPALVPDGVALLTAGIDVQDYRIEIEIVGWGRDEESWSIAYEVIDGELSAPSTVAAIDAFLQRQWLRADGRPFSITAACIDTGGHHTNEAYLFAKNRLGRQIWGIKGESARNGQRNPIWPTKRPSSRSKKSYRPIIVGVNAAKDTLRKYLGRERPGPGYMHFNVDRDLNYFKQLTSEQLETEEIKGQKIRLWRLPAGRANEALDCRVYAYAALHGLMHRNLKLNVTAERVGAVATPVDRSEETTEDPEGVETRHLPPDTVEAATAVAAAPAGPSIRKLSEVTAAQPKRRSLGQLLARKGKTS